MRHLLLTVALMTSLGVLGQVERGKETFKMGTAVDPDGHSVMVDSRGILLDGRPVIPVMGEMHYARVPESEWRREIAKMKAGGVTIMATYVFWIHHEDEVEGQWDWSGNKNLRRFVEICGEEQMPVVLRIGPFCHGEVYQGGLPCWIVRRAQTDKDYKVRSTAPGFIRATAQFYNQIGAQVNGLMWRDGGPIIGVQIENECRGPWAYFEKLYELARRAGLDAPLYTRTGWPQMNGPAEFGKILPLYGDYADGFWDRALKDMPGGYAKAFEMKETRLSDVIATETFGTNQSTTMLQSDLAYPYLTCELGGGMMPSYHRRINMNGHEAMPLCICKLGSGSNLPGYYMYHGGTNPRPTQHTMAETQNSMQTNHNDMPVMTYDFQTVLGEMGRPNPVSWDETRWLHQFLADWGEELSSMDVDSLSEHYARRGSFVFRNDYVRIHNEQGVASVTPHEMQWQGLTITSNAVQPFAKADGGLYFIPVRGAKNARIHVNGKRYTMKANKPLVIDGKPLTLLSTDKARQAYVIDGKMLYGQGVIYKAGGSLMQETWDYTDEQVTWQQRQREGVPREVPMGKQRVAAQPTDTDFEAAAIWTLDVSQIPADDRFLEISYRGDVARLYADGQLVQDNFWNGKPMQVRLSDLAGKRVELRILPLRKDAPIYLQSAQRQTLEAAEGSYLLQLDDIRVIHRTTKPL